jgi:hypothetical protein
LSPCDRPIGSDVTLRALTTSARSRIAATAMFSEKDMRMLKNLVRLRMTIVSSFHVLVACPSGMIDGPAHIDLSFSRSREH